MVKEHHKDNTHSNFEQITKKLQLGGYDNDVRSTIKYLVEIIEENKNKIKFLEEQLDFLTHKPFYDH